ncbi:imidazole glycerol phosphate synthase subunit HisH [Prosthecomicrobium hirschii]|uniref:Imidazole glycerol phosphate synthase subunit HisH n=1 Tax=Prosthecodimorpha hirschii TaxID=665126 RepID=A0A0N8GEX6_9HYPH|nr:imidazole glycerol phosphate synthase subunit HisH [Prosthecomicrobium hirschii]KPL52745.1 imidazole glycerol phosphate synthase subunit HisH [Prosthecomicrobium hirschii]TPQ51660.1 imidazole glycerol phosphate synthase subunit HisH [Prosthecomicrobium hirschii]
MTVALIDYGAGNLRSAEKGLERVAREIGYGHDIVLTRDAEVVRKAERVVLPGDGAFPFCRRGLAALPGMDEALREFVEHRGRPFLGICVGMQLLATRGVEHEEIDGFGWIEGVVEPIEPSDASFKVPHMGWNTMDAVNPHPVMDGIRLGPDGLHAYFLHSYAFSTKHHRDLVATADYDGPRTAIVARDNIFGTQFHPEKSQTLGLRLLANFLKWSP